MSPSRLEYFRKRQSRNATFFSFNYSLNARRLATNIERSCCLKHKQMTSFVYSCPHVRELLTVHYMYPAKIISAGFVGFYIS